MYNETEYNLAINKAKRDLAIAQRELSEAIIERDKVRNEIWYQRKSHTIVYQETQMKEERKTSILDQLDTMEKTLKQSRIHFEDATDKEKAYLESLERSIKEKQEQEQQFLGKTKELDILEKSISNKRLEFEWLTKEMNKVSENIRTHQITMENEGEELYIREKEIKEQETYLHYKENALEQKEKDLDRREKRLDNVKKELFSKK